MKSTKKAVSPAPRRAPRVVYTQAPVTLGVLVAREAGGWRVRVGADERVMDADPAVDPALLDEALATGARVVVDGAGEPVIAGLLTTRRALTVDRDGNVDASVGRFRVTAGEEALLRTPGAFVQVTAREVEAYGSRVVVRARELARILGRMLKLN